MNVAQSMGAFTVSDSNSRLRLNSFTSSGYEGAKFKIEDDFRDVGKGRGESQLSMLLIIAC